MKRPLYFIVCLWPDYDGLVTIETDSRAGKLFFREEALRRLAFLKKKAKQEKRQFQFEIAQIYKQPKPRGGSHDA